MENYFDFPILDKAIRENYKKQEYQKVIFLDVDGVLHDYSHEDNNVQEEYVARLKQIVDATGADIILSSSWRMGYKEFLDANHLEDVINEKEKAKLKLFHKYLYQYDLKLSGFTPYSMLGENSRPLEIRAWLLDRPCTKSFVILDDEEFNWQWLRYFLVQTKRVVMDGDQPKHIYGLDDSHVMQAISILNYFG